MDTAPINRAEYLKRDELMAIDASAGVAAIWADDAGTSRQSSALVAEADALDEAARQMTLLATARAIDVVRVIGLRPDLEGETVRIAYGDHPLGQTGDIDFLVTAVRLDRVNGTTELTGQVRL